MSKDLMRYDVIVEEALRSVVRRALETVAEDGLPGNHHFYITFRTDFPGVDIPGFLKERYPEEMTIVLQFQFYGLEVDERQFGVTLKFNNTPERLTIPLNAVTVFADPSVNFALQFQFEEMDEDDEADEIDQPMGDADILEHKPVQNEKKTDKKTDEKSGEVVSLDQFRRK
jgi:hypothetical protein